MQTSRNWSPKKGKTGAHKDANPRHRKIEKLEPEKIHTEPKKKKNRSLQTCKPWTPKNKKTGAQKNTHLRCREMQKPEPEKRKNRSPQRCKPQILKGGKTGARKIAKPEPENYQIRYLFPSPCLVPIDDEQDISTATGPFPPIFLANYIV